MCVIIEGLVEFSTINDENYRYLQLLGKELKVLHMIDYFWNSFRMFVNKSISVSCNVQSSVQLFTLVVVELFANCFLSPGLLCTRAQREFT